MRLVAGCGEEDAPFRCLRTWQRLLPIALMAMVALAGCTPGGRDDDVATAAPQGPVAVEAPPGPQEPAALQVTEVVRGLAHPTSLLFLPDGSLLVSERAGGLRRIGRSGFVSTALAGVPAVSERGGLLSMALSPQFGANGQLFFSYVESRDDGSEALAVARATLEPLALLDVQVVYRQRSALQTPAGAGGRLAFDGGGNLFIGAGKRIPTPGIGLAGVSGSELLRIDGSGKVPRDNPFAARGDGRAELWSYGHGNIHGLAIDPRTGKLWLAENWSRGGDALNIPQAGSNYGPAPLVAPPLAPPLSTTLSDADPTGPSPTAQNPLSQAQPPVTAPMQELQAPGTPHFLWEEPQGLSGLAFYTGRPGAPWNDSLFLGSTSGRYLIRLSLSGDQVVAEERLLTDRNEPIGEVRVHPGGDIFVLTDEADGKLLRITPPAAQ